MTERMSDAAFLLEMARTLKGDFPIVRNSRPPTRAEKLANQKAIRARKRLEGLASYKQRRKVR